MIFDVKYKGVDIIANNACFSPMVLKYAFNLLKCLVARCYGNINLENRLFLNNNLYQQQLFVWNYYYYYNLSIK